MGIIRLNSSKVIETPWEVVSWTDNPAFSLSPEDYKTALKRKVKALVFHTTMGTCTTLFPGVGPEGAGAENNARYWRRNKRSASAQLLIDHDGSMVQTHYLQPIVAWHARGHSLETVGIELVQTLSGGVYQNQIDSAADFVVASMTPTAISGGMDIANPDGSFSVKACYDGRATLHPGGRGAYGHRDCLNPDGSCDRGKGDPGDCVMTGLVKALEARGVVLKVF